MKIVNEDQCAGCFACYNVCPTEAIKIELNPFGFYIPQINTDQCSNCGQCLQYCPVNSEGKDESISLEETKLSAYGAWSNDDKIRYNSSSGGLFTELALLILEEGGVVFGAGWDNQILQHLPVEKAEDLENLRGSKYIPSYIGTSYNKVCQYLEEGRKVLFMGTPCQIAALKGIVRHKNLIAVDLICHGVPSILAFNKYLISKIGAKKINKINFRDKELGWEKFSLKITTVDHDVYKMYRRHDPFLVGYLKNLYLNSICYNCPFARLPKTGEITLGDFWGVAEEFKDQKGVSVVLINKEQGKILFDKLISEKRITVFQSDIRIVAQKNPRLIDGRYEMPEVRKALLQELTTGNFKSIEEQYIKPPDPYLFEKINARLKRQELIFFGTGSACQRIFDLFIDKGVQLSIKYLIDNNPQKWGERLFSKVVYAPAELLHERKDLAFIIVASSYYGEIKVQLEEMGFTEDDHFINGMDLLV